jgi:hypothetical protein
MCGERRRFAVEGSIGTSPGEAGGSLLLRGNRETAALSYPASGALNSFGLEPVGVVNGTIGSRGNAARIRAGVSGMTGRRGSRRGRCSARLGTVGMSCVAGNRTSRRQRCAAEPLEICAGALTELPASYSHRGFWVREALRFSATDFSAWDKRLRAELANPLHCPGQFESLGLGNKKNAII